MKLLDVDPDDPLALRLIVWIPRIIGIIPLLIVLKKLHKANQPADFHSVSTGIKLVMFTGILSMLFFRFYLLKLANKFYKMS
ncbi:MAG: hypothetical protein ACOVOS_05070, partial [Chitinophagaceae bacterium]